MHLAKKINRRIDALKDDLCGVVGLEDVKDYAEQALKPWGVNIMLDPDPDLKPGTLGFGGMYDFNKTRKPIDIILYHGWNKETHNFTKRRWLDFRFGLSQVLQHELVHKYQFSWRQEFTDGGPTLYYDIKGSEKSDKEHMDYLAELDEIDAYAHDIAMEILYHYPRHDPYHVLKTLNKRRYIWSYNYYKKAFKHSEDWSEVRNRLLKKTYLWLPHVVV